MLCLFVTNCKTGHKTLKCLICFIMPLPNPHPCFPPPSYTPIAMFTINILFVCISCILHIYVKNVIKLFSYFAIWKKSQNKMFLFNYKRLFGGVFHLGRLLFVSDKKNLSFEWKIVHCTSFWQK